MTGSALPSRQDTAFWEADGFQQTPCPLEAAASHATPCNSDPPLQSPPERSLVPAVQPSHRRSLSAASQQQLSRDIVRDVLDGLPLDVRPSAVTERGPQLRVERVAGDSRAIDVTVVCSFRAHFNEVLPASPDPASPPRPQVPLLAAAGGAAGAGAGPAPGPAGTEEQQQQQDRQGRGSSSSSSLLVEELSRSSSESLGQAAVAGALHVSPRVAGRAAAAVGAGPPQMACRVEMPESPHGSSTISGTTSTRGSAAHSEGSLGAAAAKAAGASKTSRASSRSSSAASMATPSTAEGGLRQASTPEGGSSSDRTPRTSAAAAAGRLGGGGGSDMQPLPQQPWPAQQQSQQQGQQQSQQQGQQQQRQEQQPPDASPPLVPPAAWEPPGVAAAEVQRRFSQDQQWFGLQRERLSMMGRQDSLMPFEINPHDILVGERLAVGGFAEVFLGRYQGTAVAIKLLLSVDERGQQSFRKEVHLLEQLRHPHIVLFMGICTRPYLTIVTEYMARGSLFKLLRRGGNRPLPAKLQRSVAVSVARGMAYLHSRSPPLVHLDLKSPNILLDDRWRVKIADFGLSRLKSTACLQNTGAGTPEWMAPEILRSECYDERADVYSYGVVLWECLTGQQPWEGLHPVQVVGAVGFQGKQLPMEGVQGDLVLVSLCRRCLAIDPRERPTFPQILQELEQHFAPRSRSNSMGSQQPPADGQEPPPLDTGGEALPPPPLPLRMPAPALRLPAAVTSRRGGAGGGAGVPGLGMIGATGGSSEEEEGEEGGSARGPYGGHDSSPFAPSGPLPPSPEQSQQPAADGTASPFGAAEEQQQEGQLQPGTEGTSAQVVVPPATLPAAALHPAFSMTNDSPFAQLPPFSDEDGDEGEDGAQRSSGFGATTALATISEGASSGGGRRTQAGAVQAQEDGDGVAAAAAAAAEELSHQLNSSRLSSGAYTPSSIDEPLFGERRLSSGSLVREPSSPLVTLAEAVGGRIASQDSAASGAGLCAIGSLSGRLAKQQSAGELELGLAAAGRGHARHEATAARSASQGDEPAVAGSADGAPASARTVAAPFNPPSVSSVASSQPREAAAWTSLDTSGL